MPPKSSAKVPPKIVYPPGVKEITDDLGADELIRRLKACAQAFQNMGQDDNNQSYIPLSMHLAADTFLEHANKDVRLLVACCIADVFRVYAPDAPYKDPEQLKNIFLFFIKQLRGLADPKDPAFKRYFYLLENLAWVKSFNICIELEENQDIFCQLFNLMFSIVNDEHSAKVKNFMLDVMSPLISEADSVSQNLLDIILSYIIEPKKSQNRNAYNLARDLLKKTSSTIEPYIQAFFNNALILGKTSASDIATHLYELIYELNSISPSVLLAVLPQLEFKLKSNDEKERLDVTRLLARMFSDKNSELATQHRSLWTCFLGRFNDISVGVRNRCVQYSMHFLLNHPELRADITEQLKLRQHDPEETVRYEVVMAIISAAKKDFTSISDDLLDFVKERTLDKKFKIRKEALIGLSMIYKKCMNNPQIPKSTYDCVSWIKDKVLHVYYQTALEDRLLVERILHTCLVPYQLPPEERMKKMYQLYATVDDHAVKAFNELLKCQNVVRNHVRSLLDLHKEVRNEEIEKQMGQKIVVLAKSLPEPVKAQEFLKKFNTLLITDNRVRSYLEVIVKPDCLCREAEDNVRELLKKLGNPVMTNVFYMTVKQLLERVAPVLIDRIAVQCLLTYVDEALQRTSDIFEEVMPLKAPERGLKLLHTLSYVFPASFYYSEIFGKLVEFLKMPDETAAEITLQILCNVGNVIETNHPEIASELIPVLMGFTKTGTVKQAKHAVKCLYVVTEAKELHFGSIVEELKTSHLTLASPHFRTALVTLGHIAYHCPESFAVAIKGVVTKIVVQQLLMQDKEPPRTTDEDFCSEEALSEETKAKIEGMKLMVRWLLGLNGNQNAGNSTLKLLTTVVDHDGDLMEKNCICRPEKAWLRMTSGCCILKIAQETSYVDFINPEQFQVVAKLINDECYTVRERFAQKLHKGLISLKLPLDFMAIFALGSCESNRELKNQLKQYLLANINKRRDYLKQHTLSSGKLLKFLPDYVLPYAIHLLAHHPDFKKYDHLPALNNLKECLWFLMEPLITKNENYSFGFFKKLLENIKQTKDAMCPADEMQNLKLYAVCDLALGLVMSKTSNFVLKEFPVEPKLPSKLYTALDKNVVNTTLYLPPELATMFPKGLALDLEHHKGKLGKDGQAGTKRPRIPRPVGTNGAQATAARYKKPSANGEVEVCHVEAEEQEQPAEKKAREDSELESSLHPTVVSTEVEAVEEPTDQICEEEVITELIALQEQADNSLQIPDMTTSETDPIQKPEVQQDDANLEKSDTVIDSQTMPESSDETLEARVVTIDINDDTIEEHVQKVLEESEMDIIEAALDRDVESTAKKRTAASLIKVQDETAKRLRSSGFKNSEEKDEEKSASTKASRSARQSQLTENKTTSNVLPATRVSARQMAKKQQSNSDASSDKSQTDSDAKEFSKKVMDKSPVNSDATSSKGTTSSSSASPQQTTSPARRILRRTPSISNGANQITHSDEDSQESATVSPRKSTRVQTRSAHTATTTKNPSTTTNVKRQPARRTR